MQRNLFIIWVLSAVSMGCAHSVRSSSSALDLTNVAHRNQAFLKTRGSTDPNQEIVFYWKGQIYARSNNPDSPINKESTRAPLFHFEGFNIARFIPTEEGIQMLSREVSFYLDSKGEIIDCWDNPFNGSKQRVVHVFNDPVNFKISSPDFRIQGDTVSWLIDINLIYPSPLSAGDYGEYSPGNKYRSFEMFNFLVKQDDLRDPVIKSAPTQMTWSRVGQFLPWMRMGKQEGELVYSTSGYKVLGGFSGLPKKLREQVLLRAPKYASAPKEFAKPNMTSWRFFKEQYDNGNYDGRCTDPLNSKERE